MNPIRGLRVWWQRLTGDEETPFDGDAPVWVISMLVHLVLLMVFALIAVDVGTEMVKLDFLAPAEEEEEELVVPEEFHHDDFRINEEIGAHSNNGAEMALSVAPIEAEFSVVPSPQELTPSPVGDIEINEIFEEARGMVFDNLPVKGHAGEGTTGATGAVDRITSEILLSLEERKTLVVWLFDKSPSMLKQREEIHGRFDRIYEELGVIEAAGNPAFARHEDKPLLTSIVSFGKEVNLLTKKPTDNVAEIKEIVKGIDLDDSGTEHVFEAVYSAVNNYNKLRAVKKRTGEPERNVMLLVFTDEAGEDQEGLDATVHLCKRFEVPVYVIGVPAPFGRNETLVKWVDPDPKYDQSPRWGRVDQGPETLMSERIKLSFEGNVDVRREERIDSGFGPFALTRLAYETGGIYFAVHPNRSVKREVSRRDTEAYSAHLTKFFDPEVMRRYKPDYVSMKEYQRRLAQNKCRFALVTAASKTQLKQMANPQLRFEKRDEAAFSNALTEAQKQAAVLGPRIQQLFDELKVGEKDREKEPSPRWQAGYDLAMGRVIASLIRTDSYNAMLAQAKRGLKPKNPKANIWKLTPSDEITTGSSMKKLGARATEMLQAVVDDHSGTPWAYLAAKELEKPFAWKWEDEYVAPPKPAPRRAAAAAANNNAPAPARNENRNMNARPKPKRPIPKL